MSSKTKTTATKEDGKPALVPKLRFPEFREADGWDSDELGKVAGFVNEKVPLAQVPLENYVSTENILPDYGGVGRASKLPTTGSVTRFRPNDTLVSNIRPYLKKVWVADKEGGASNDVIVIRAKQRLLAQYFSCLLKNDAFIDYVMTGAKGVKMPRGDISSMKAYPTLYPSKPEQQKIAECLSSVDELIAAQARKLDALKTHKKWLMQQLFPREGETQPRLGFPEFKNAWKWAVRKAGSLFKNRVTKGEQGLPIYSVTMHDGMVRRDSLDRNYYDIEDAAGNKKVCRNDIAYNMMRMWQGALGVAPEDCLVSPAYIVLAPVKGTVPEFFQYMFKLPATLLTLTSHSRGLTKDRLRLYYDDFARITLRCPPPAEQQRIADCLTSLDDLITAQTQKHEALKTHKKGLMQQIFPSPEEVDA
ncbi:MAG: restriction endonuclease subunit S [Nitrospirota bacterium]